MAAQFKPLFKGDKPTLGWQVIQFLERYVHVHDREGRPPITLTEDQTRFFVDAFELDPVTGVRVNKINFFMAAKSSGKTPTAALLCIAMFCGPVVFDGWDDEGQAKGKQETDPRVIIAAYNEDQVANTYNWVKGSINASPKLIEDLGVKVGLRDIKFKDYRTNPGYIMATAVSSKGFEGQGCTLIVADELHHWEGKRHHSFWEALRRDRVKRKGMICATSNAYTLGANSVLELEHEAWQKDPSGVQFFARHVKEYDEFDLQDPQNRPLLKALLVELYSDILTDNGGWFDVEETLDEIYKGRTNHDIKRFYLNQPCTGQAAYVDPIDWAKLERKDISIPDGTSIVLGFDGSRGGAEHTTQESDHTFLVAMTVPQDPDAGEVPHLFVVGHWAPPESALEKGTKWLVPTDEVSQVIADTFDKYNVQQMACDPPRWETYIDEWQQDYGDDVVIKFNTNTQQKNMTTAINYFREAIQSGQLTHDGDVHLKAHILNAELQESGGRGYLRLEKPKQDRKIDGAIAATLARFSVQSVLLGEGGASNVVSRVYGVLAS